MILSLPTDWYPIYKRVARAQHPSVAPVIRATRTRVEIRACEPLPARALTDTELAQIRDGLDALRRQGIIVPQLLRSHLGWHQGAVCICLLPHAGIVSSKNPYKWIMEPFLLDKTHYGLRQCDFDAYISGVFHLDLLTECAWKRFVRRNTSRRRREAETKRVAAQRRRLREDYRVRRYLQTGEGGTAGLAASALRRVLGATTSSRQALLETLQSHRRHRHDQTRSRAATASKVVHALQDLIHAPVLDPIQLEETPLHRFVRTTDYHVLIVLENGRLRAAPYTDGNPEICYACRAHRPWQAYLPFPGDYYLIRSFEGDRYLIPRIDPLPRILVVEATHDTALVVSRRAIQEMNFVGSLHCQPGSEMRVYTPNHRQSERARQILNPVLLRGTS